MIIFFTQSAERRPQGIEERVAPTLPPSVARVEAVSTNLFTFFANIFLGLVAYIGYSRSMGIIPLLKPSTRGENR